ncbi:5-oxoprolinase subunit PxpA [Gaetbulibacter aquiaggeris]|uniref:5-oxoprolinase subunit PxpA n=1 Tax=Gaetbulibacter aquiaggeris TaxID=1735373 RepID=A0ABW7MTD2_9FLAO
MGTGFIDINVDVGEGIGNESILMPIISSCNIACGGHAGDTETMRKVVKLAAANNVKIGAHPSFPDKANFGRKPMDISCAALYTSIKAQIDDLMIILKEENTRLNHVKPHGALYNMAAIDHKKAFVIIEVMKNFILPVKLFVPFNSVIEKMAIENNIPIRYEAFADRNYNEDGSLVSRNENNALIHESEQMFNHVYRMISSQKVKTIIGSEIKILADTFCIHGDNPKAIDLIQDLIKRLLEKGIQIK